MAICIAAGAGTGALVSSWSPKCYSSAKLTNLSSLQFPKQLRRLQIGNYVLNSNNKRSLPLVEAKKQTFSTFEDLLENSDKPLLVDFYATWCGPCQFMVPILNEVGDSMKDKIQVVKIDTEKYPAIANKYNIQALPTFILFKDGEVCDRFVSGKALVVSLVFMLISNSNDTKQQEGALNAPQLMQRIEAALEVKQ